MKYKRLLNNIMSNYDIIEIMKSILWYYSFLLVFVYLIYNNFIEFFLPKSRGFLDGVFEELFLNFFIFILFVIIYYYYLINFFRKNKKKGFSFFLIINILNSLITSICFTYFIYKYPSIYLLVYLFIILLFIYSIICFILTFLLHKFKK